MTNSKSNFDRIQTLRADLNLIQLPADYTGPYANTPVVPPLGRDLDGDTVLVRSASMIRRGRVALVPTPEFEALMSRHANFAVKIKPTRRHSLSFNTTIAWTERRILGRTFRPCSHKISR